jgi:hypothetical protein
MDLVAGRVEMLVGLHASPTRWWAELCFHLGQFIVHIFNESKRGALWKNESVERLGLSKRAAGRCLAKTQSSVIPCAGTNTEVYAKTNVLYLRRGHESGY